MAGSAWTNQVQNQVIVSGTANSGIFAYSPSPALNQLVFSEAAVSGTDPYGNAYLAGLTNYQLQAGTWNAVNVYNSQINWYTATSEAGPWTIGSGIDGRGGDIIIDNGSSTVNIQTVSGTILLNFPNVVSGISGVRISPPGVGGTTPGVNALIGGIDETWHAITLDAGWSASTQAPQYRMLPDGNVQVRGVCTHTSVTANTNINSGNPIGSDYRPAQIRFYRAADPSDTAGLVQINTAGVFQVHANASFPATQAVMDGVYSLA